MGAASISRAGLQRATLPPPQPANNSFHHAAQQEGPVGPFSSRQRPHRALTDSEKGGKRLWSCGQHSSRPPGHHSSTHSQHHRRRCAGDTETLYLSQHQRFPHVHDDHHSTARPRLTASSSSARFLGRTPFSQGLQTV